LNKFIEARVLQHAEFYISNESTCEATAKKSGFCAKTVYNDLAEKLPQLNPQLASEARRILNAHRYNRHKRRDAGEVNNKSTA
jgi:putative DeoR family transcriptional regulator (stage III sporulation protein D)